VEGTIQNIMLIKVIIDHLNEFDSAEEIQPWVSFM